MPDNFQDSFSSSFSRDCSTLFLAYSSIRPFTRSIARLLTRAFHLAIYLPTHVHVHTDADSNVRSFTRSLIHSRSRASFMTRAILRSLLPFSAAIPLLSRPFQPRVHARTHAHHLAQAFPHSADNHSVLSHSRRFVVPRRESQLGPHLTNETA